MMTLFLVGILFSEPSTVAIVRDLSILRKGAPSSGAASMAYLLRRAQHVLYKLQDLPPSEAPTTSRSLVAEDTPRKN